MGGPAYQFDAENRSPFRLPRVFDGHPLFYEWTRDYVKVFELNRPNGGRLEAIHHLFGGPECANPNIVQDNPMDMEFGPDGALYTLEYGDGFFAETPGGAAVADRLRARRRVHAGRPGVGHTDDRDHAAADGPVLERGHGGS